MDGSYTPEAAQGAEVRADGAGSGVEAEERKSTRVAVRGVLQPELDDSRGLPRLREETHSNRRSVRRNEPAVPTAASATEAEDACAGSGRSVQGSLQGGHATEPAGRTAGPGRSPQGRAGRGEADWHQAQFGTSESVRRRAEQRPRQPWRRQRRSSTKR